MAWSKTAKCAQSGIQTPGTRDVRVITDGSSCKLINMRGDVVGGFGAMSLPASLSFSTRLRQGHLLTLRQASRVMYNRAEQTKGLNDKMFLAASAVKCEFYCLLSLS
jgi:hypothetical protein